MFRKYLLNKGFWPKKKSDFKIYIKHDQNIGGIYAIIHGEEFNKGVEIIIRKKRYFFNNFNDLDQFFEHLKTIKTTFMKILKLKLTSPKFEKPKSKLM